LSGSYSNPAPPIGQINVVDRGATVVGWSLVGLNLSDIHHITVSFEIMTDVLTPGPYGGRVTTAFGFTNSTTFASTTGLHFCSAYDTGHRSPSSRLAASWKPRVEYR